mgnify:CR=1 FL=1
MTRKYLMLALAAGSLMVIGARAAVAEGSVAGAANRNGERSQLAGDVEEGVFTLEESVNGQNISATWRGDVVEGTCGKEIRGIWTNASDQAAHRFVLRKLPGWQ